MPVALGPPLKDPLAIVLQITVLQTAFFLLEGMALALVRSVVSTAGDAPLSHSMLFDTHASFLLLVELGLHGLMFGPVVAYCVERRRFCLDFVATSYGVFALCCWLSNEEFPTCPLWWMCVGCGAGCALGVAYYLCLRNELQEVPLASHDGTRGADRGRL